VAIAATILLAGCGGDQKIVGSWKAQSFYTTQRRVETRTFNKDGSYTDVAVISKPGSKATLTATDVGTWKPNGGDTYAVTVSDIDWVPTGAPPALLKRARDHFAKEKPKLLDGARKGSAKLTVQWVTDKSFTADEAGQKTTFQRVN